MTHEQFIDQIGQAVQKIAPIYGIQVCSPIIAQAILESAWGTSNKAAHHNYFGLKYRKDRLTCHSGTFVDGSSEQLEDGSYIPITAQWFEFATLEKGVEGYFQFINTPNYQALKGITNPYKYLVELKKAGYATSRNYVANVWKVIQINNLQRFDKGDETTVNSKLATYERITGNHSGKRTTRITKITPHYMAAGWTGKQCADYFANSARQASSNYCIGVNGDIAVSVPEGCRAWTSASNTNDQSAVTIECGNNPDSSLPDPCYKALVALCADICQRHGINPHYDGTPDGSITLHRMFTSTSCPGPWLTNKIASGDFEKDIKAKMAGCEVEFESVYEPITKEKDRSVYRLYNPNSGDHLLTTNYQEAEATHKLGWIYEGIGWIAPDEGCLVYRLYNSNSGQHTYSDKEESEKLEKLGWKNEGPAFHSGGNKPLYRLYNPNSGAHLLTANRREHDVLCYQGWCCEGQEIRYS